MACHPSTSGCHDRFLTPVLVLSVNRSEDRSARSTIVTSQLPVNLWHEGLGDETVADATLDRLLERSHRFELVGDSRRQRATSTNSRNVKRSK